MSTRTALWGFTIDVEDVRARLAATLDLVFERHYSDAWGGWYWNTPISTQPEVQIFANFPDEDGVLYIENRSDLVTLVDSQNLDDEQFRRVGDLPAELLDSTP